jgi:multicomponent Na+:H+ antiporter subunit G
MNYFNEILGAILIVLGVFFVFLAGVGLLRMPDMFLRMSTATKASTLGLGLILMGTAVFFWELGITSRAIATSIFVLLTAPVSAHMIGRAAYSDGVPLWDKTKQDDLKEYYETNHLVVPDKTAVEPEPLLPLHDYYASRPRL